MEKLNVASFLMDITTIPVMDVRSPGEYTFGHIPTSISLPLFTDKERAIIGTLYKKEGKRKAIKEGLNIVGPKMLDFIEQAEKHGSNVIGIYCWRGGMRSESMAWLLERYGFKAKVLDGGYKAYRRHIHRFFKQKLPLKVITGYTGSKKTALLHMLATNGEQVVDLEGLAQHQGSSFGNQKSICQPTTEHFQNLIFDAFNRLDLSRPIWVEDECRRIGQVTQVESLYYQIQKSPLTVLEIPKHERVAFLVEDYGHLSKDQLIEATYNIRKKLGYDNAQKAIDLISKGELKEAVEIILKYYDKRYQRSILRKPHLIENRYCVSMKDLKHISKKIVNETQHAI